MLDFINMMPVGAEVGALITGISTVLLVLVAVKTYHLSKDNGELVNCLHGMENTLLLQTERMKHMQEYAHRTRLIDYRYVDVILLGPREAGKTSLSQLWTSPWTQIAEIQASHTWRKYETNVHEFDPETEQDPLFEVDRVRLPVLRIRVHDYPGENQYRLQAIKSLLNLNKKVTLLFVFRVGYSQGQIRYTRENSAYFSRAFVEEIKSHIPKISATIAQALVVFNKVDLLPGDWSDKEALENLKAVNADAIHEVERVFSGMVTYHMTSARTNKGVVSLLGEVGRTGVAEEKMPEYDLAIATLEKEFELHGI